MASFLDPTSTSKKVQNNINMFESLSLTKSRESSDNSVKRSPIIEVDPEVDPVPLLSAISSKSTNGHNTRPDVLSANSLQPSHKRHDSTAFIRRSYLQQDDKSLIDDAREILKSQPGLDDVQAVLSYLEYGIEGQHDFNVKITSPKASMLVHALVSTTLPDLWPNLGLTKISKSDLRMKNTLLAALFSVTGIEVILEHIKHQPKQTPSGPALRRVYLDFLGTMLSQSDCVLRLLKDSKTLYAKEVQRKLFWQSIVTLIAGGKILSTAGSVALDESESASWLSHGFRYSQWLGRNIVKAATDVVIPDTIAGTNLSQLLKRGLSLGYKDILTSEIYTSLLLGKYALWSPLHNLIKGLPAHDQKIFFDCVLNDLSNTYFSALQYMPASSTDMTTAKAISGAAALINGLVAHNDYLLECAVDWVTSSNNVNRGSGLRRALIAVLAQSQDNLQRILDRSLVIFSDNVHIQNSSFAQQEHLAQTILLAVGYLHRLSPAALKQDQLPTLTMRSVSNRLSSSVPRTRLLGMIVGVGMSRCVDEPEKVMNFKVEEMETTEVKELLALIYTNDAIGELSDLKVIKEPEHIDKSSKKRKIAAPKSPRASELTSKILAIEEVSSSSDDEEDLVPYRKPLEDPEDSDEDPTLINRDKPKVPIYIVDLIKQLQLPNDKLDVITLALKTAPGLIRRKAEFGTELADNIHSLASALINLQEGMSKPEPQQDRLDALVACMVSRPKIMGHYLTSTYFNGDFSLSQRSTILIVIGLGARELAGFADASKPQKDRVIDSFPSQRLPTHLQSNPLTSAQRQSNAIADLTNAATHEVIRPLALAAAESQAGPKILQINRTSTSLTSKSKKQQQQESRKIPKAINSILANETYLPLASPLTAILSYATTRSTSTLLLHPSIITLHLQTLTLLLHTLGPTGLSSPSNYYGVTQETLLLLVALTRNRTLSFDGVVLPALLGLLLALIDITVEIGVTAQERLLGEEFGGVVSELVRWASTLEDSGAPPPTKDEDGRGRQGVAWTVLAAGIQVRWMEIGRRFQGRMLGLADEGF